MTSISFRARWGFRAIAGSVITVVVLVFAAFLLIRHGKPLTISEWGDFLAGFAAVLAFVWLVLGYAQQAEELHLNTKALTDQANETKELVEQARTQGYRLAEQVMLQREQFEHARDYERRRGMPQFLVKRFHTDTTHHGYHVEFNNDGPSVTLRGAESQTAKVTGLEPAGMAKQGTEFTLTFTHLGAAAGQGGVVVLEVRDKLWQTWHVELVYTPEEVVLREPILDEE